MKDVKEFFKKMVEEKLINAKLGGPKENVLICESMKDWCIASGELVNSGYEVNSPGHYGGGDSSRQNIHRKIWTSGVLCASVIEKKVLIFSLPHSISDYCDVIEK